MSWKAAIATIALVTAPTFVLAQDGGQGGGERERRQQGGQRGGGQDGGGQRNFDPAEMQRRRLERMKEQLGAPDDEWKVLEPKITKVLTAQRDAFSGFGGFGGGGRRGGGGPGGGGPGGGEADNSPVAVAQRELRTLLERENASAEEIDKKLAAFREARAKAAANLEAARKELKELLSAKQEASLVLSGVLE